VVFENCYQGNHEKDWENSLDNKVDVVGWVGVNSRIKNERGGCTFSE
jgi:hypothetical protein